MKSVKQIMAELGFNPDSSLSSQKAFIKHLVQAANQTAPQIHAQPQVGVQPSSADAEKPQPIQLEFVFAKEDKQVS